MPKFNKFAAASLIVIGMMTAAPAMANAETISADSPVMRAPATAAPGTVAASTVAAASAQAATAAAIPTSAQSAEAYAGAPVSELVAAIDIPYEQFTLDNGLKVLVHTDRKAPVVAVSVWYGVGSKHEPKGKTGFAHLFEHLMFNGSENAPNDAFEPLQQIGATDYNGSTWFDRTNYFETVPKGALDTALMLESDRMGHLLGAVTQEKLDNQIGVVQNEKRQGDNQPYGIVEYEQLENLYPSGHPYHHSTIGSMKDLSSATLEDVKGWFKDNYGPNNAILVLAGDIDLPTAKEKVNAWFGDIPAGRKVAPVSAPVPDKPVVASKTIYDQVPSPRVYRMWAVPGLDNSEYIPLYMGAQVLGGLASSRLDNALVRDKEVAVRVVLEPGVFAQAGQLVIYADPKPGVSPEDLGKALDAEIADFLKNGPTEDELQRATTSYASQTIRALESVGGFNGKAPKLAEGLLYNDNPEQYKKELETAASLTPEQVRAVTEKWLSRQPFELLVLPGTRKEGGENRGGYVISPETAGVEAPLMAPAYYMNPAMAADAMVKATPSVADRSTIPTPQDTPPLDFPAIERTTLSNGIPVYFARRDAVPTVTAEIVFDAGSAANDPDKPGIQEMMLALVNEGTTRLGSQDLAIAKERLGAALGNNSSSDDTSFFVVALEPNLAPSLNLLSEYVRSPGFRADDLERVRAQQLNQLQSELSSPIGIASRAMAKTIYGDKHPYGASKNAGKTAETLKNASRDDLVAFHDSWITPKKAEIYVVGDTTLAKLKPMLEKSFGNWQSSTDTEPQKNFDVATPKLTRRIVLIDRPESPQSVILGARRLPYKGTDDLFKLEAANVPFGGNFLSRINTNLRETKGWSYGVGSQISAPEESAGFILFAPVQGDRTGDSIQELIKELAHYTSDKGVNDDELTRLVNSGTRTLPGKFETSLAVFGGVSEIIEKGYPDDYYEKLSARYQALTKAELDNIARQNFRTDDMVFIVVGDAKTVRPQLDKLGIPVETLDMSAL